MKWHTAFGLLILLMTTACHRPTVLARIGETDTVTRTELLQALNESVGAYDASKLTEPRFQVELKEKLLNTLIDQHIIIAKATEAGIHPTDDEIDSAIRDDKGGYTEEAFQKQLEAHHWSMKAYRDQVRQRLIITQFVESTIATAITISDAEVAQYYKDHTDEFVIPEKTHARHIIVDSPELANTLYKRLQKGENFANLATQYSMSPEAENGGDLGYFSSGQYPRIFDDTCGPLPIGALSQPVKSEYGIHLFKIIDRIPARKETLDEAKERIRTELRMIKTAGALQSRIERWRSELKIKIFNSALTSVEVPKP